MWEPKPFWQHSASILHVFKEPFMQKESARDASFQIFKFISLTIGIWARRKHNPSLTYSYKEMYDLSSYKWKRFRFSKVTPFIPSNTTINVLHGVPSSIINYILEAFRGRSRFWDHTFSQAEFARDDIIHGLIGTRGWVLLKRKGLSRRARQQIAGFSDWLPVGFLERQGFLKAS